MNDPIEPPVRITEPVPTVEVATVVRKHPVRGFFWGLVTGVGLALCLVTLRVITLAVVPVVLVVIFTVFVCVMWGIFGPPKAPKGPAPVTTIIPVAPGTSTPGTVATSTNRPADSLTPAPPAPEPATEPVTIETDDGPPASRQEDWQPPRDDDP